MEGPVKFFYVFFVTVTNKRLYNSDFLFGLEIDTLRQVASNWMTDTQLQQVKCYKLLCKLKTTTHSLYTALYSQLNQTDSTPDSQLNDRHIVTAS